MVIWFSCDWQRNGWSWSARLFMPRHNAQMRLLKAQIHILRARIPARRIILSPAEKSELLRIGAEGGHDIDELMEVTKLATYNRWLAQTRSARPFKAVGRPRLTQELRDVVNRIGSESLLWWSGSEPQKA